MHHTWRIIGYFTSWGTIYGFIIGMLTGAAASSLGAYLGAFAGAGLGAVTGLIISLITALIHRQMFHQDIDMIQYRRRLAAFNGLLVGIVGLLILLLIINDFIRTLIPEPRFELKTGAELYPLLGVFIFETLILTTLGVAYITSHFPDWLIQSFYSPDPPPRLYHVRESFTALIKYVAAQPYSLGVIALGICFHLNTILEEQMLLTEQPLVEQLFEALLWSSISMPLMILYLCLGNAVLLTFLKRLLVEDEASDFFTYHYKSMTVILSFLFTVLMTSWSWTLAPLEGSRFFEPFANSGGLGQVASIILGLFMAFHVFHTLAVDFDEKAKRKEKLHDNTIV